MERLMRLKGRINEARAFNNKEVINEE